MKTNFAKSIAALMVVAIAMMFIGCSKDDAGVFGNIDVDNKNNPEGTTYELVSSEHLAMGTPKVNNLTATFPSQHVATFKSSLGKTFEEKYNGEIEIKLGAAKLVVKDLDEIQGKTFRMEDGAFNLGNANIPVVIGEPKVTPVRLGNQIFNEKQLSGCYFTDAKITFGNAEMTGEKSFRISAVLTPSNKCEDTADAEVIFENGEVNAGGEPINPDPKDEVKTYINNVTVVDGGLNFDYVVEHTVNTELNSVEKGFQAIDWKLSAEEKKMFDTAEALIMKGSSVDGNVYTFVYNLFNNAVTASYPKEVVISYKDATYTFTMPAPAVNMVGMNSANASDADYNYVNYTINYVMTVNSVNVAAATQEVSTRVKAAKDEVTYTFENVVFTENGVEYDFVEKHSENPELNNSKHYAEKVNFGLTAEAKKTFETEAALSLTDATPSVNGKVYSFAWNLFTNRLTASYPTQITLSQKGQTYVFNMPNPAVKMANLSQNAGQNATHNFVEYTIAYVMTVNNIEVASATQQILTKSEIPVNPTIEGWEIDPEYVGKGAMTDKYNGSREALHHTSICYVFRQVGNAANKMMVEFAENGVEMGRYDVSGLDLNIKGFYSMVWNGNAFIPAVMQGVSKTSETPQAWKYVALNGSAEGQVSPVSVNAHSLRNPLRALGNTIKGVTTINGITLK